MREFSRQDRKTGEGQRGHECKREKPISQAFRERQNWRVLITWLRCFKIVRETNRFGGAAMDDAQRRDMWAGRIERRLSAGMAIKEWCMLNKVSESNLYRWMARFREEEPGRFPRRSSKCRRLFGYTQSSSNFALRLGNWSRLQVVSLSMGYASGFAFTTWIIESTSM